MAITPIFSNPNNRVFYACQAVLYKERQTTSTGGNDVPTSNLFLTGVQSIGIDSEFPFSPYQDLGRFQQKYGSYGKQLFTINIERVISDPLEEYQNTRNEVTTTHNTDDGQPFYKVTGSNSYTATHMLDDANLGACGLSTGLRNWDITLIYGNDANDYMDGGVHSTQTFMSTTYRNCILTSISYNFSVDGTVSESITLTSSIATQDTQESGFSKLIASGYPTKYPIYADTVKGRDIDFASCVLPVEVKRMFDLGNDGPENWREFEDRIRGLQNIEMSVDIEYVDLPDIGQWRGSNIVGPEGEGNEDKRAEQNRFKQVGLPVGVSFAFTGVARAQYRGDIQAIADASTRQDFEMADSIFTKMDSLTKDDAAADSDKVRPFYKKDREFRLVAKKGQYGATGWVGSPNYWQWHLGQNNYLTGLSYSGGEAGGGNVEVTLNYQNDHSDFVVFRDTTVRTIQSSTTY